MIQIDRAGAKIFYTAVSFSEKNIVFLHIYAEKILFSTTSNFSDIFKSTKQFILYFHYGFSIT